MPEIENPWEKAAIDPSWNQANFSMEEKTDVEDTTEQDPEEGELGSRIARCVVNSWHFADAAIGFVMLVYGILLKTEGKEPKVVVWTLLSLGTILLIRATFGTWSVYKDVFGRMGILLSAYFSTVLAFSLFIASMTSLGMREKIAPYLRAHQEHLHLSSAIVGFIENHVHFIWAALLVCSFIEAVRWLTLVNYHAFMLEEDELSIQLIPQSLRRNRKPWWWSSRRNVNRERDDLADPLLGPSWATSNHRSYQMDHGLDSDANTSMWSRIFGRSVNGIGGNIRDDASVDFASVQEDWASRSEEDPLWWTRDEGDTNNKSS